MVDRNKIWERANELGALLADSPEVAEYKAAEEAMEQNADAQVFIRQFRELQEQLTQLEDRGTEQKYIKPLQDRINEIVEQMDQIPEVQAFKKAQQQVNQLLSSVSNLLVSLISKKIENVTDCECHG